MATAARWRLRAEVVSDPTVLGGVPVVRGTRVPVAHVLAELKAGTSRDEVFRHYSSLPPDGVEACVTWERKHGRAAK